jgi:hypothetical protein
MLLEVTVSGSVGKQVVPTTEQRTLRGYIATPSAANMTLKIRDGNASGEVVLYAVYPSAAPKRSYPVTVNHKFTKGMHVKVIGTANVVYLDLS